eukprot:GHVR01168309.1.p1 GENE.GHVR01168309.1~~GHVR01168309.1.p1  ORF type:complete len:121 (-),score=0.08 GHVR01168309.1:125-487(-)
MNMKVAASWLRTIIVVLYITSLALCLRLRMDMWPFSVAGLFLYLFMLCICAIGETLSPPELTDEATPLIVIMIKCLGIPFLYSYRRMIEENSDIFIVIIIISIHIVVAAMISYSRRFFEG